MNEAHQIEPIAPIERSDNTQCSAQVLVSSDTKDKSFKKKSRSITCRYCENNHWSDECKQFETLSERKDKIRGSCFLCLKKGHMSRDCTSRKACVYCGEMNVHHRSLCPRKFQYKRSIVNVVNECDNQDNDQVESGLMSMSETVLMQTAVTEIMNPDTKESATIRLLFDSGSHRSYVSEKLAHTLNLKVIGVQDLHVATFGNQKSKKLRTKYANLDIKLKNGRYQTITVNIVPLICGDLHRAPLEPLKSYHVKSVIDTVELADTIPQKSESGSIDLLIGNDYYLDLMGCERIHLQPGLYLVSSKLGWIISGRYSTNNYKNETYESNIEDFWNIESIGIMDKDCKTNNSIALEKFRNTVTFVDNRYHVTWPWKDEEPNLPSNRELAIGRLKTSVNKMKHKPDILQNYNDIIHEQLKKGIIEPVDKNNVDSNANSNATTKLRIVYDASAKSNIEHNSLNECLYRGPVMIKDLCGMLMRFRLHPIAIVADIEKAFLQISLHKNQRDVTRFVWLKDITTPTTNNSNIQEYRFCRVPFGIISSPFLLGATIETHLESYKSSIAEQVKQDIYVDNLITGVDDVKEAQTLYSTSKKMFNEASMNLRQWITNNPDVNNVIDHVDRSETNSMKVLGHIWNVINDTLSIQPPIELDCDILTKRIVLKQVASYFDPLGLISPVTIRGKQYLQELWNMKVSWDEQLNKEEKQKWSIVLSDMKYICHHNIPRFFGIANRSDDSTQIICFCDASEKAYAAAIYLRQVSDKNIVTYLMFAKTRLAPVKKMSIPRLELMAVVIGIRCIKFVKTQLRTPVTCYLFSDSECVLHWIKSNKQLPVFINNRVGEIKDSGDVVISYVPTKDNPADIASRGMSYKKLKDNELWWYGPEWLQNCEEKWPKFDISPSELHEQYSSELQNPVTETTFTQVTTGHLDKCSDSMLYPLGILISKFSSYTYLIRVTALVIRFIQKLKKADHVSGFISSEELAESERLWFLSIQKLYYTDVFNAIDKNQKNTLQYQLGLFVDRYGILRCKGRLENSSLHEGARYPILLPKQDRFTHLLIDKVHKELLHSGTSQTLATIRQRFWITHGRATVKAVLKSCRTCRRFEGASYKMPPISVLPKTRVTESTPFSYVGLDYLGPLIIKTSESPQKVWICLFTCLVTRAVHLELVCDMTTAEFLLCFRRFIAQRGTPTEIISDNAMQFRSASTVLDRVWIQLNSEKNHQ